MAKHKKKSSTPKSRPAPQAKQAARLGYYFVVSGEVEYHEGDDTQPRFMKVNGVHVEPVAQGKPDGITVKGLAQIQTLLQMHFHTQYSKTHPRAPTITNVVILSVSHLGVFTEAQFYKDAPEQVMTPPTPATPAEQTLPTASAEQTLPEAPAEASPLPVATYSTPDVVSISEPVSTTETTPTPDQPVPSTPSEAPATDYLAGERTRTDPTEFEG